MKTKLADLTLMLTLFFLSACLATLVLSHPDPTTQTFCLVTGFSSLICFIAFMTLKVSLRNERKKVDAILDYVRHQYAQWVPAYQLGINKAQDYFSLRSFLEDYTVEKKARIFTPVHHRNQDFGEFWNGLLPNLGLNYKIVSTNYRQYPWDSEQNRIYYHIPTSLKSMDLVAVVVDHNFYEFRLEICTTPHS